MLSRAANFSTVRSVWSGKPEMKSFEDRNMFKSLQWASDVLTIHSQPSSLTCTNLTACCFGCVMWSPKDRLVGDELFCLTCGRRDSTSLTQLHQMGQQKYVLRASDGVTYSCALSGVGMWVLGWTDHWWETSHRTGPISSLELKGTERKSEMTD